MKTHSKTHHHSHRRSCWRAGTVGLLCLLIGFAPGAFGAKKKPDNETKNEAGHIFFPIPPDPPRVQFLLSFSSGDDLPTAKRSRFSRFVTGAEAPKHMIMKPYGMAIHGGKIVVTDTVLNSLHILDLKKWKMRDFRPQGQGLIRVGINVTFEDNGRFYVADTGRNQVTIFDEKENYLGAIGARDEMKPTDVAVSADRLYITDLKGSAVRVYDKEEREFLFTIPRGTITETNQLFSPTNLALDSEGNLYVSDTGGFRVQKYDADGNYLRTFGKHGGYPGTLARPKGVAVDREGRLYVVDAATQVLQMWNAEGQLLLFFGEPGNSAVEFNIPSKVVVDYDHVDQFQEYAAPGFKMEHLIFVVNQYGSQKISVFGFGNKEP